MQARIANRNTNPALVMAEMSKFPIQQVKTNNSLMSGSVITATTSMLTGFARGGSKALNSAKDGIKRDDDVTLERYT